MKFACTPNIFYLAELMTLKKLMTQTYDAIAPVVSRTFEEIDKPSLTMNWEEAFQTICDAGYLERYSGGASDRERKIIEKFRSLTVEDQKATFLFIFGRIRWA